MNNDNQSQTLTEIESTLDPCEKALAKKNSLIKVRGKRDGQMVYIIVEKIVRESLIAVINKRSEIGILEENRQLFALPGKKLSFLTGCVVIAKFAKDCGLRHLKSFTSTNLRKYLATTLQVKNFIIYKINDRKSFFTLHNQNWADIFELPCTIKNQADFRPIFTGISCLINV